MARVSIEQSFFAGSVLKWLGKELLEKTVDFDQSMIWDAIGKWTVVKLWQESQARMLGTVDAATILIWCGIDITTVIEPSEHFVIQWLERGEFIERDKTKFYIKGNAERILAIKRHREKSKQGGIEKRKRARTKKEAVAPKLPEQQPKGAVPEAEHGQADCVPQEEHRYKRCVPSVLLSSGLLSSVILSSEEELINKVTDHSHDPLSDGVNPSGAQEKPSSALASSQKPAKPQKAKQPGEQTDGSKVWTAYAMAYKQRMGVEPIRNAKQNAMCSQLVQRLGVENAVLAAAFYLGHPEQQYMRAKYPLGLLLRDCEGIFTEYQKGQFVTTENAKRASVSQQNNAALERYLARCAEEEKHGTA